MTKDELQTLNAELIEFLTELRDQIVAKLDELEEGDEDDD